MNPESRTRDRPAQHPRFALFAKRARPTLSVELALHTFDVAVVVRSSIVLCYCQPQNQTYHNYRKAIGQIGSEYARQICINGNATRVCFGTVSKFANRKCSASLK